ncbi:MAG TPA: prepilin-type N-terminal cleavage/methylation domain-containing protein [Fimbriimonadaceae bacterium]|nr:prepilin-type N-terminal cleavage/methylation domain-containing protein [Fimbriimonadaceae bacterium]
MRRSAFTLIELLTVIAVIAVLAAIAFPVMARAKDNAYRSNDISNMNSIRTALQLYRVDQGAFPPALLGYVTLYTTGPNAGQVMPANELKRAPLYPRRVSSLETLRPNYNRVGPGVTTTAVWPNADPRGVGTAPQLDLDGDGDIDPADDPAQARQFYGPAQIVQRQDPNGPPNTFIDAEFYKISGYDVAEVRTPTGNRTELRYTLFWSEWGLGGGNATDDPRQLGYTDPPDTTVVTWNSFFRDYTGGVPDRARRDLVLFLGGNARAYDSRDVHERSWRILP